MFDHFLDAVGEASFCFTPGHGRSRTAFCRGYTGERTEREGNGFSSGLQLRVTNPKRISNCNDL
jgi:hypothetical protein